MTLVGLLLVTAFSSGGSDTGSVAGTLELVGGPPPGVEQPLPGAVTARFSDGRRVVVPVRANGQFRVKGHVGAVVLTGRSPQYVRGTYVCAAFDGVTVQSDSTVRADVLCPAT
jgi:hypothetical protein